MRDPNMLNSVPVDGEEVEVLVIANLPEYDIDDYDIFNEKDFKQYIIDIKRTCRNSFEYREMVNYLRDNLDMNKCSFYENVNNIDTYKIKIHIHHDPFTLEDICLIVYNKRKQNGESLEVEMVSKEVMLLHYNLMIGLIPLAETPHELVHNQYLFIPADVVLGRYKDFINLYEHYMEPEQLHILNNILEATKHYRGDNMGLLDKKLIYVDITGSYKLPELSVIKDMMGGIYSNLKNNNVNVSIDNNSISPIRFVR